MSKHHKSTRRMNMLRTVFMAEGKQLDAIGDKSADCWLCKLPIDYSVLANSTPESHNLDHYFPVADYPELQEDPTNFRHAHSLCNGQRSNKSPSRGLGDEVPAWW